MNRAESAQGAATQMFPQGGLPFMSQQGPAGTGGSGSGTPTPRRVLPMSPRWDFPAQLLMPPQVPGSGAASAHPLVPPSTRQRARPEGSAQARLTE